MTDRLWRMIIWTALGLSVMAHFFLIADGMSINKIETRLTELERAQ